MATATSLARGKRHPYAGRNVDATRPLVAGTEPMLIGVARWHSVATAASLPVL